MLKKSITYEDYDGNVITEDFFFNLSKAELVELEVSTKEGLAETLKHLIASNDGEQIIATFKKIILLAYGIKSGDGKRFIKSDEMREAFAQTEAYSTLFMELATDATAAAKFINGVVPSSLVKEIETVSPKQISELSREELLVMLNKKTEE